jgi:hypothetical protein
LGSKTTDYYGTIPITNEVLSCLKSKCGKIARAIGLDELYTPGDDQRNKQLDEISYLIQSAPMLNPMTGGMQSTVPIEPQVDNDQYHIETCQAFLSSEMGMI